MTGIALLPFSPDRAKDFDRINRAWIEEMFCIEPADDRLLTHPETEIMAKGGTILFAALSTGDVVGTGALLHKGKGVFEIAKMGTLAASRGKGAGRAILRGLLCIAQDRGAREGILLSNRQCTDAIHLYRAEGFSDAPEILQHFGEEYSRCDLAMRYGRLSLPHGTEVLR